MSSPPLPPGTLYVVATPIGNLEDVTIRALKILEQVSLIAAEDTRRTARLLNHFGIATRTISLHEHNERARASSLIDRLQRGESIALVTDAGTPLLSDPGRHLTRQAIAKGFRVEPIPGPSALTAALAGSGAVDNEFAFLGFPPNKSAERRRFYERAGSLQMPFVIFEAPHRVVQSLTDALDVLGDRPVVICRELTKVHEEFRHETLSGAIQYFRSKDRIGELTLVFPRLATEDAPGESEDLSDEEVWNAMQHLIERGSSRREAIATLARRAGRSARDIYAAVERGKARQR